MISSSQEQ